MKIRRKKLNITRLGIGIICMMLLLIGVAYSFQIIQKRSWNHNGRFNVVDVSKRILTSYPASSNEAIVQVALPENAYFLVPGGYGYYKLKDIIELSNIEKGSDLLVLKSISYSLGIPVEQSMENLSLIDRLLIWKTRRLAQKDIRVIDLYNEPIFTPETRKDGTKLDKIDPDKVDLYLTDTFWERDIKVEPYTVGVFNATEYPGLASGVSRLLEHVGYRVVNVSNWDEPIDGSCSIRVYGNQQTITSASYKRLTHLLPCTIENISGENKRYTFEVIVTDAI